MDGATSPAVLRPLVRRRSLALPRRPNALLLLAPPGERRRQEGPGHLGGRPDDGWVGRATPPPGVGQQRRQRDGSHGRGGRHALLRLHPARRARRAGHLDRAPERRRLRGREPRRPGEQRRRRALAGGVARRLAAGLHRRRPARRDPRPGQRVPARRSLSEPPDRIRMVSASAPAGPDQLERGGMLRLVLPGRLAALLHQRAGARRGRRAETAHPGGRRPDPG